MRVKLLLPNARVPSRITDTSIGYDLFTPVSFDIEAYSSKLVDTGVAIDFGDTTAAASNYAVYGKIESKSGIVLHKRVTTLAGVIDPDYRGSIQVFLQNFGDMVQRFEAGDRIAQLVFIMAQQPKLEVVREFPPPGHSTQRGEKGWGEMDLV